eukprot:6079154-Ditylum_brightwellii.AAC.1
MLTSPSANPTAANDVRQHMEVSTFSAMSGMMTLLRSNQKLRNVTSSGCAASLPCISPLDSYIDMLASWKCKHSLTSWSTLPLMPGHQNLVMTLNTILVALLCPVIGDVWQELNTVMHRHGGATLAHSCCAAMTCNIACLLPWAGGAWSAGSGLCPLLCLVSTHPCL